LSYAIRQIFGKFRRKWQSLSSVSVLGVDNQQVASGAPRTRITTCYSTAQVCGLFQSFLFRIWETKGCPSFAGVVAAFEVNAQDRVERQLQLQIVLPIWGADVIL